MVEKEDDEKEKVLEMSIDELELSVRSYNCLKRAGINTVEELINKTPEAFYGYEVRDIQLCYEVGWRLRGCRLFPV